VDACSPISAKLIFPFSPHNIIHANFRTYGFLSAEDGCARDRGQGERSGMGDLDDVDI
jgi:hypothetical protein